MALDNSILGLLNTLRKSLHSATEALPSQDSILSTNQGISLLDVKNELLLSYLHNLVFLILLKLRQPRSFNTESARDLNNDVVKQLVELRVYLERGVKPLEGRLKYQVDKVLQAADDSARLNRLRKGNVKLAHQKQSVGADGVGSEADTDSEEPEEDIDELSYRPNPSAFQRPVVRSAGGPASAATDGIYRPPRIAATIMPDERGRGLKERRPHHSAVLDEFITTELSAAPVAEPSIGSTIIAGGRHSKSQRERKEETERKEYEETNFVRLPTESKAERAKKATRERGGFGGEEWKSIDAGLDRIDRLTQRKGGKASGLERSRKRAVEDSPRGDGLGVGERFAKRRMMDTPRSKR